MNTIQEIPKKSTAIYKAAELINTSGPRPLDELVVLVDFGPKHTRKGKLVHAYDIGWLRETPAGTIDITESTRAHFAEQAPKEKFVGQVAAPAYRGNVFGKPLSRHHIPNRRGPRADAPALYGAGTTFHRG
jgi:hypothetical protein